ncbi:2-C-methyl-D-erythritol 4-phosphate cytidylyltransferase [Saliniradius amylolyticus]|uniref:2-C-methyl-D-erythritol 4-phosphate cytidylyltransferase n=1 Tax=Saliniradius amylolyticus TaxID=2183582 RepID=A0A2S2E0A0_9ALTE|nr:2-C-methyl-D-erythritol 4-phosphate cytidylyltransferase [Saliniradius amylolyticus]AWL11029.1 2-C-methyl-D-erythritol 4-phosphate cytidylyltransferase [Saliniradius amylolyticus]
MSNRLFSAIVPAAGIGSRMGQSIPKQYLSLGDQCILAHTLDALLAHPAITQIVVALNPQDADFATLPQSHDPRVVTTTGGAERADSVLAGLQLVSQDWVLVHDAARPCLTRHDLDKLMTHAQQNEQGAILATPVRDTMKRANEQQQILHTEERQHLWHALTPQLFPRQALLQALQEAQGPITDEASAMEQTGYPVKLIQGCASNIKVTQAEDLALAEFYLRQQHRITE